MRAISAIRTYIAAISATLTAAVVLPQSGCNALKHRGAGYSSLHSRVQSLPHFQALRNANVNPKVGSATTHEALPKSVPLATCFNPYDPPTLEERLEIELAQLEWSEELFNPANGWQSTLGTPIHLRYSFVPDGTFIPASLNVSGDQGGPSVLFQRMNALFANAGGQDAWTNAIRSTFDRWAALTGTSYTFVSDDGAPFPNSPGPATGGSGRGDIRISMRDIGISTSIGGLNFFPPNGDMILNARITFNVWNGGGNLRILRNIVSHEHGHGLGLRHVCPQSNSKIMEPTASTAYDGPQQDDLRGIHSLYGDALEPNNNPATAKFLGHVTVNGQLFNNLSNIPAPAIAFGSRTSIHGLADEDWYVFNLSSSWSTTIKISPVGSNYDSSTQNPDTSCNSGNITDAARQANLAFQIIRPVGTFPFVQFQVLHTVNRFGRGQAEAVTGALSAGGYFIRVFSSDTPSGPQLYTLTGGGTEPMTLLASQGQYHNRIRLAWPDIPGAPPFGVLRSVNEDVESAMQIGASSNGKFNDVHVDSGQTYYYWIRSHQWEAGPEVVAGPVTGFTHP